MKIIIRDIATLLGASVIGDELREITSFAGIEEATEG